jgi:formylmethanofuran dehydrogenase subunit B
MNAKAAPASIDWTCPFCSLLCDSFRIDTTGVPLLRGSTCPRARAALAAHREPGVAPALVDGIAASLEEALAAAARRLASWCQPLFGGGGTDIAGARALTRLALRTGAICDHADGAALMHGVRALQDSGQATTTLGEIGARADLVVCIGTDAVAHYPEFFHRCGLDHAGTVGVRIVFLGAPMPRGLPQGIDARAIPGLGDLFADLQQLAALVAGQRCREPAAALAALATELLEARYAVLVWEAGVLPAQGALLVEAINRMASTLNRTTRAATLALGGSDGACSLNQVHAWLTGLPLRTRAVAAGLEHEPLRFAAERLLADRAVDGRLWLASFEPARLPPAGVPCVVLGPPAMATRLRASGALDDCIFVAVATPGLNAAGHLLRTDGSIVVPLVAARDDGLPGADAVLSRLDELVGARP